MGRKANLSPNLCLTSHQCWPRAQTLHIPAQISEDGEGGARRGAGRGLANRREGGGLAESLASRPSLLISPSISHTYIYFFSNSPSLPAQRTTIIGLLHMRIACRGGFVFSDLCKETTRIFRTTHNHSPPPPL